MADDIEDKKLMDILRDVILGMNEIDQEVAILDELFREQSYKIVNDRIKEVHSNLLLLKEKVENKRLNFYKTKK